MSGLFKLSRELRDEIYLLCLVTDYEINAEPTEWERVDFNLQFFSAKPSVALLRVNKLIHAEASIIFYGRNHFHLPTFPDLYKPSIFKNYGPLFRHIVVSFDFRDVESEGSKILAKVNAEMQNPDNDILIADSARFREQFIHSETLGALFKIWARKKKTRFPMKSLRTVVIDLGGDLMRRGVYNHDRFFRDVMSYWSHAVGFDVQGTLPTVSVRGVWPDAREMVYGKWAFPEYQYVRRGGLGH